MTNRNTGNVYANAQHNSMRFIKYINILGIYLTLFQQMPVIKDKYYAILRIVLYTIFGISALFILFKRKFRLDFLIKNFFICVLLWWGFVLLFFILGWRLATPYNSIDIFEPLVPLGMLIISSALYYSESELYKLLFGYVLLATIMGLASLYYYGYGLEITPEYIRGIEKNQVGPIISVSCISCLYMFVLKALKRNKIIKYRILFFCFALIDFVILVFMRNRSGLIATILCLILIIVFYFKSDRNKLKKIAISIVMLSVILYLSVFAKEYAKGTFSFIYDALTLNYNIYDLNNLSAGRLSLYERAIEFIKAYPLFGELKSPYFLPGTVHNFLINKLVKYGLIGSLPIIIIYIYIVVFVFKSIIFYFKNSLIMHLGMILLIQSLFISLLEYSYPFGPGVSQILVWFFIGQYISKRYYKGEIRRKELGLINSLPSKYS